jgi:hypothetical protein
MHTECTVQSRQDFLQRGVPSLDSDDFRGAANLDFGKHRRRSNCQGGAQQDCDPNPAMTPAEGSYWDGPSCGQFCNLPLAHRSYRRQFQPTPGARYKMLEPLLTVVPVINVVRFGWSAVALGQPTS